MQQQTKQDRSLGELFGDLTRDTSTLVRQEVQLAKTELTQQVTRAGKDVGVIAAGGALAYAGLLALVAAVIAILVVIGLPVWLAALIVGVVLAVAGYFLVQSGLKALKTTNMAPKQTIETLKEDAEWAKQQTK